MSEFQTKIFESAIKFFLRYGFKKTSVDEIAEDAGIGKGTIYNYFKNKEDLFIATTAMWREQQYQLIEHEVNSIKDADEKIIMRLLLEARNFRGCIQEFGMTHKVVSELISVKQASETANACDKEIFEQYLLEGVQQGIFPEQDCHESAQLLLTVTMRFIERWVIEIPQDEAEKEIRQLIGLILKAFKHNN